MDLDSTFMRMEQDTKGIGKTINKMELDLKLGQMVLVIRVNIIKAKNQVKDCLNGKMDHITRDNFKIIIFKELGIKLFTP